jgi:hypothetical protein
LDKYIEFGQHTYWGAVLVGNTLKGEPEPKVSVLEKVAKNFEFLQRTVSEVIFTLNEVPVVKPKYLN